MAYTSTNWKTARLPVEPRARIPIESKEYRAESDLAGPHLARVPEERKSGLSAASRHRRENSNFAQQQAKMHQMRF
jgi:hypothetical protein